MNMDIRTLFVVLIIASVIQIIAISFQYTLNKLYKGIIWWVWSIVCFTLGYLYILVRISITESPSLHLIPNFMFVLGITLQYISLMRFLDKPLKVRFVIVTLVVYGLVGFYFTSLNYQNLVFTSLSSLVYSLLSLVTAWRLWANRHRSIQASAVFIITILLAYGGYFAFRTVGVFFLTVDANVFTRTVLQTMNLLVPLVSSTLLTIGLIIMINQQLNADMKQAKEHFEQIFSASPDAVTVTRISDSHVVDINEGFTALFGYNRKTAIGGTILDLKIWVEPAERQKMLSGLHEKGMVSNYETTLQRQNGSRFNALVSGRTILLNDVPHLISIIRDISDRREMMRELNDQRGRLAGIIEGTHIGTWEWNVQTGVTVYNEVWAEIVGYSLAELAPVSIKTWERLAHPEDLKRSNAILEEHFAGGLPFYDCECRMKHKNGHWVWVHDRGRVVSRTDDGHPLMMFGTHADITQRKLAEETLQKSETRFHTIYDSSPIGIELYDEKGQLLQANSACLKIFGISGTQGLSNYHLFDAADIPDTLKQQLRNKKEIKYQTVFNFDLAKINLNFQSSRTGKADLDIIITPLTFSSEVEPNGFLVQFQEITLRKQAEARLKESEEKHRLLVENSHDIIYILDLQGIFTFVSPSCTWLLGHPVENLVGRPFQQIVHPEDVNECLARIRVLFENGQNQSGVEYRVRHQDGSWRWHSSSGVLLHNENGEVIGFEGSAVDITERKILEEKVQTLYEQEKQQRQQLEEEAQNRIRFIDLLAHELKGPLTPMLVSSEILRDSLSDDQQNTQRKLAENIHNGSQVLFSRLEELLEVARYARGAAQLNLEPVDARRYLEQVAARFAPSLSPRRQHLEVELGPVLPVIELDPSRIEQVLINLLSNASKYSPEESRIRLSVVKGGKEIVVAVQDEGIGISIEDQARLFQPYQRVGREQLKTRGLGLGLTVVKYIVEAHGGQIRLTSTPGQGSTFSFSLPIR
jgi:two-component system, sensor histidine kinase and response regulator